MCAIDSSIVSVQLCSFCKCTALTVVQFPCLLSGSPFMLCPAAQPLVGASSSSAVVRMLPRLPAHLSHSKVCV